MTALADWNAAGSRMVSRNRSAMSRGKASPLCSWMNPSWGMAPMAVTATTAADVTATEAWLIAWLGRSAQGVGAVVTPPPPVDAVPLGDQAVGLPHAGPFHARSAEMSCWGSTSPNRKAYILRAMVMRPPAGSAHARICRRATSEVSGISGGAV